MGTLLQASSHKAEDLAELPPWVEFSGVQFEAPASQSKQASRGHMLAQPQYPTLLGGHSNRRQRESGAECKVDALKEAAKCDEHLADVFDLPSDVMYDYYLAYRELMARLKDSRYKIELKLAAGQMVVFDNRRVLHGRNAFDENVGERRLKGCYVDRSEFKSRLRTLKKQLA